MWTRKGLINTSTRCLLARSTQNAGKSSFISTKPSILSVSHAEKSETECLADQILLQAMSMSLSSMRWWMTKRNICSTLLSRWKQVVLNWSQLRDEQDDEWPPRTDLELAFASTSSLSLLPRFGMRTQEQDEGDEEIELDDGILRMALPKRKLTPSRKGKRQTHKQLKPRKDLVVCLKCKSLHSANSMCMMCFKKVREQVAMKRRLEFDIEQLKLKHKLLRQRNALTIPKTLMPNSVGGPATFKSLPRKFEQQFPLLNAKAELKKLKSSKRNEESEPSEDIFMETILKEKNPSSFEEIVKIIKNEVEKEVLTAKETREKATQKKKDTAEQQSIKKRLGIKKTGTETIPGVDMSYSNSGKSEMESSSQVHHKKSVKKGKTVNSESVKPVTPVNTK